MFPPPPPASTPPSSKPVRNAVIGVGNRNSRGYLAREETVTDEGRLKRRILERPSGGSPYHAQTKINAYNFPFTGNAGSGCFFQCIYCYLRQPFFQNHVTADHGKEMNFIPDLPGATRKFLEKHRHLPQYMKRVQLGVSTEMFMPQMLPYTRPDLVLEEFRKASEEGNLWMVHVVTKSPAILNYARLLAEMRAQVQVEVSFVTLDEDVSGVFERGTPSVLQRLGIIEVLAGHGVFVRFMMMPAMREYALALVDGTRQIVFEDIKTGMRRPGRKLSARVDGNFAEFETKIELHDGRRWEVSDSGGYWKAVVVKDWSFLEQAQSNWRNFGASAYKQKDLNYFHVDELIAAHREGRSPKAERGRSEDPTAEQLIHSGETAHGPDGRDRFAHVQAYHLPRTEWGGTSPPIIQRRIMDFGYTQHSAINWVDCI